MRIDSFVGGLGLTRSRTYDSEIAINLYVEPGEVGSPRNKAVLMGTPGLRVYSWLTDSFVRGLFSQDGRGWFVAATDFGEIPTGGGVAIYTATVANDDLPVTFASNGQGGLQVMLTSAELGYIFDLSLNTLTQITDVDFPTDVSMVNYFDGYFSVLQKVSGEFYLSDLMDGLAWDALDVYQRNIGSDVFVAQAQNGPELWCFGSKTTLVYVNTGDVLVPLEPIQGVLIQQGCLAPYSVKRADNTLLWLSQNEYGQAIVCAASGYSPKRVSTFPVEQFLSQSADLTVAEGFVYQARGHTFYGLYVPDLRETLTFDIATQTWTTLATWNSTTVQFEPWRGKTATAFDGQVLVGDRASETVYRLDFDANDDELVA